MNRVTTEYTLSYESSIRFLQMVCAHPEYKIDLFPEKSRCLVSDRKNIKKLDFRYPLCLPGITTGQIVSDYFRSLPLTVPDYIILLIRAGQAALGGFQNGNLQQHKVIRKYMIRKKQGKAQIYYQKKRPSASPGARLRLANTISFFIEINSRLQEWFDSNSVEKIIYSCTPPLWAALFRSKIYPPFDQRDARLIKIPLHIPSPDFKTLRYLNHFSLQGNLHFYPTTQDDYLLNLFNNLKNNRTGDI
jgi:hypothetical protein